MVTKACQNKNEKILGFGRVKYTIDIGRKQSHVHHMHTI